MVYGDGRFIADTNNRIVPVATKAFVAGQLPLLLLVGPTGSGKTAILDCLSQDLTSSFVKQTAADFFHQYVRAIDTDSLPELFASLTTDVTFLLDDLHHLLGKEQVQIFLGSLLDEAANLGNQVVLTCRSLPQEAGFLPRFASRLSGGLTVQLNSPSNETRRNLINVYATQLGLQLTDDALDLLVTNLSGTVTAIHHHVTQLHLHFGGKPVAAVECQRYLNDSDFNTTHTPKDIISCVARYYQLRLSDFTGSSRRHAVAAPRSIAMYLCRQYTSLSLQQIGDAFGGRDHTTVMHSCRKIESQLANDTATQLAIKELKRKLPGTN